MKNSKKYMPPYKIEEQLKIEISEKITKGKTFEIARKMKNDNVSIENIIKYTGISTEELDQI